MTFKKERVKISCPAVVRDYSLNMNGVDKSDCDGRDNSMTIRSNRWYLRIWFWTMEELFTASMLLYAIVQMTGYEMIGNSIQIRMMEGGTFILILVYC